MAQRGVRHVGYDVNTERVDFVQRGEHHAGYGLLVGFRP